jgi:hypothetical protein
MIRTRHLGWAGDMKEVFIRKGRATGISRVAFSVPPPLKSNKVLLGPNRTPCPVHREVAKCYPCEDKNHRAWDCKNSTAMNTLAKTITARKPKNLPSAQTWKTTCRVRVAVALTLGMAPVSAKGTAQHSTTPRDEATQTSPESARGLRPQGVVVEFRDATGFSRYVCARFEDCPQPSSR